MAYRLGGDEFCVPAGGAASAAKDALRIADQRMYERKNGGRRSAGDQSKAVLVLALSERYPI